MGRRKLREEIFKLLFERELVDNDMDMRLAEVLEENDITKEEDIEFMREYIKNVTEHKESIEDKIKSKLVGWSFDRLGTVEKTLLKMSFYEITEAGTGHEIVINETVELAKKYGEDKTPDFINGILADLVS
ncbi:transcription antitermination factor NusB [Sebaldella sp. S0638]|uniref:transcription antitermination factor NusB n=1 Tax=Sebaldella sp. S0638 TaxID=2957809 RepID=UPI00209DEDDF|nr:transcription antitermination factor NusB [Sebaldella sp. S0638]MCP1224553.1 transcription antitermination factor NusB [Sebaldella sp. S0638]